MAKLDCKRPISQTQNFYIKHSMIPKFKIGVEREWLTEKGIASRLWLDLDLIDWSASFIPCVLSFTSYDDCLRNLSLRIIITPTPSLDTKYKYKIENIDGAFN